MQTQKHIAVLFSNKQNIYLKLQKQKKTFQQQNQVQKPQNQSNSSSLNLQIIISPLSLQDASRPASFGFQETQLASSLWALVSWATSENTGSSGLAVTSSLKTLTASSPQAVARAPVSSHLNRRDLFKSNNFTFREKKCFKTDNRNGPIYSYWDVFQITTTNILFR